MLVRKEDCGQIKMIDFGLSKDFKNSQGVMTTMSGSVSDMVFTHIFANLIDCF